MGWDLMEDLVASIHESWFCAMCMMNTSKPAGEGDLIMQTTTFLLVALMYVIFLFLGFNTFRCLDENLNVDMGWGTRGYKIFKGF